MRVVHSDNRLLRSQRKRRGGHRLWLWLVGLLLLVNLYLFGVRGLPGMPAASAPPNPAAAEPPPVRQPPPGALGEMRGVAGVRSPHEVARSVGRHRSAWRFDLQEAASVAGVRTLEQWCTRLDGSLERGDTLSTALIRAGLDAAQSFNLIEALRGVLDFRRLRERERFEIWLAPDGTAQRFFFRPSPLVAYRVSRRAGQLVGERLDQQAQVEQAALAVRIEDSLYASLERAGESAGLVMMLVDVFAWDIDFYVDTQRGDVIRLVVEKLTLDGQPVGYGRILAAEYDGVSVGLRRAFAYTTAAERGGYYDEKGGSLRKAFLKSPLKFVRISSGFGMRVHPILGFSRMHAGIDFSAPRGTPVQAPADGTVLFAGIRGGYGRLVHLRHANGYETLYGHLNSIAREVRAGTRVHQKQVIGGVGSTGLSTGPHLHYEMRLKGRAVNPLKQHFPPADPVPAGELDAYRRAIAPWLERLQAIPAPAEVRTARAGSEAEDAG